MTKHFISMFDLSAAEICQVLKRAGELKAERHSGNFFKDHLKNRPVAMIFNKNSTRTRVSFECAINELGGHPIFMAEGQTQFSRGEPISHSARVLSRYVSAIVIRTYAQQQLDQLAQYGSIPIINALTDEGHPCQILTDILTIMENFPDRDLKDIKIAWVGDGNNMAASWLEAAAILGFPLSLACPEGYDPDPALLAKAQKMNGKIELLRKPSEAVKGALAINTDVWASMGQEEEQKIREQAFKDFQVNSALMNEAAPGAVFLHCLPAHPGEEVTEEVLESSASVIFDQAENRLHAQKALLEYLIPAI